ncbi:MAG: hypothetical protein HRJ53_14510 [Acidobacteria bacterium Pan2503]|uniref:Uncharacterized protein n=1 Tax=Candidatus Acidiferrum panamense TaxID=2741543 RepID=A0A7V8NRS1_9BACT|nr:hypothetical protein [Candidatus Acidoferrum panamensis]
MGNRIAKFEGEDRWIVYASVTEACYEPIFFDELSAWLYAHYFSTISRIHDDRSREHTIGEEVTRFVHMTYGDSDEYAETPLYLDECASVTAGTTRGQAILSELTAAFTDWDRHSLVAPRQPQEELD